MYEEIIKAKTYNIETINFFQQSIAFVMEWPI